MTEGRADAPAHGALDLDTAEVLPEKEIRYGKLLDAIQDGIYVMDTEGRLTFVNDSVVKRTELPREALMGKSFLLLIEEPYKELVKKNFEARLRGQPIPPYEISYTAPSGRELWVEIGTKALFNEQKMVGVIAITGGVTERKRAELALRASEERFRSLFERHAAAMLLLDPASGKVLDANEAAARFYGYSRVALSRMNVTTLGEIAAAGATSQKSWEGEETALTIPHRLATGQVRVVEVHSSPISVQGAPVLFSIMHDVTERTRAEEELRRHRDVLEELVRDRTRDLEKKNEVLVREIDQRKKAEQAREALVQDLTRALQNIRTLNGLLPICAWCKKVRNDSGYWEQIEVYVHNHSEADFSHSICPEGYWKHYGEYGEFPEASPPG